MMLALDQRERYKLSVTGQMPEQVRDQATMEPPKFERCFILLSFQKLMI